MDVKKIEELIEALESSEAVELSVKKGDMIVRVRRGASKAQVVSGPVEAPAPQEQCACEESPSEVCITAPMVGLFHAVDGLSEVGAQIKAGQVVGAIESMKLLNDIVSDVSGTVIETMVEDGMPVEYNQVLCKVKVSGAAH